MNLKSGLLWGASAIVVIVTAFVVITAISASGAQVAPASVGINPGWSGDTLAAVGSSVLLAEDLRLAGLDDQAATEWVEDELLAQLAEERGLENPRLSALVQSRARQLYLRDLLLTQSFQAVPMPTDAEVMELMMSDSQLYMVERHFYHILLADRDMADSLYGKLLQGESFQISAERLSIGQKAGLGGDMGWLVAGELTPYGFQREEVTIDGIGGVVGTELGWHILLVDDTRPLTDTVRVMGSMAGHIYRQRIEQAREDLLLEASGDRVVSTRN